MRQEWKGSHDFDKGRSKEEEFGTGMKQLYRSEELLSENYSAEQGGGGPEPGLNLVMNRQLGGGGSVDWFNVR